MKYNKLIGVILFVLGLSASVEAKDDVTAPAPCYPIPTENQVEWQKMETYAFVHFGLNTFNNREWGYGDSPLSSFNPTRLNCEQWVRTFVNAGFKGVILTCKHHDGFCLWPTKYTDYCVRNTPFRDGKGDVVGELAAACKKYGIKFGVYLSPWDRHQAFYGTPLYIEYYYSELRELLTKYGDLFEVWFDGANGGDGWYGGTKETRTIDRRNYYNFPRAFELMKELQPHAVAFSDGGPGCRWVGNEKGFAFPTNWSFLRKGVVYPGYPNNAELQTGHADGDQWVAAECDVSIRPGWFYHSDEDKKVKTVDELTDLYYRSVGHNGSLLINFPVDKDGLIYSTDSANAVGMHQRVTSELKTNLLLNAKIKASDTRGKAFAVKYLVDNDYNTYWATPDDVTKATLEITFPRVTKVNRMKIQEYITLGQRVKSFVVEYKNGDAWTPLKLNEETTTVGYRRLLRFPTIETRNLRIRFLDARACLCINEIGAYYASR
jgi:alpha-L-fucosidase